MHQIYYFTLQIDLYRYTKKLKVIYLIPSTFLLAQLNSLILKIESAILYIKYLSIHLNLITFHKNIKKDCSFIFADNTMQHASHSTEFPGRVAGVLQNVSW